MNLKQYRQITASLLGTITLLSLLGCASNSAATKPLPSLAASGVPAVSRDRPSAPATPTSELPPAPSGGLSADQQAELKTLGIPVVIPAYLPPGFQASKVVANSCQGASQRGACREGPNYAIVYRNDQNSCLLMNAIGGGVGGGAAAFEFRTSSALLGDVIILFGQTSGENKAPTPEQLQGLQPNLSSFPQQLAQPGSQRSPYYNVVAGDSGYYQTTYGCGKNTSITPAELEKVVQSLVLLN